MAGKRQVLLQPSMSDRSSLTPEMIAFATRMYDAARAGQLDIFQQALPAGLPVNMTNDKGDSLIMLAAYHGHSALVSLLISHGADPNTVNDRGQSPLAGAVFKNEREVIQALLDGGADPDLGTPSATEAVRLFKVKGELAKVFGEAREKLKAKGVLNGESKAESEVEGIKKV